MISDTTWTGTGQSISATGTYTFLWRLYCIEPWTLQLLLLIVSGTVIRADYDFPLYLAHVVNWDSALSSARFQAFK